MRDMIEREIREGWRASLRVRYHLLSTEKSLIAHLIGRLSKEKGIWVWASPRYHYGFISDLYSDIDWWSVYVLMNSKWNLDERNISLKLILVANGSCNKKNKFKILLLQLITITNKVPS